MADLIENCKGLIGLLTVLGALLLGARAQQQEFRLVGSDVTLVPKYTGDLKEITWILNDIILVEIVLKPQEEFIHHLPNDRTTINNTNGALTIRNLTTGDSGLYEAEILAEVTEIRLTVRDCPDQPTISVQSTEDWFVVSCKSFSPDITYKWFNQTTSVSMSQSYAEPKKNGILTCVVDNKVCNKSSSINFYIPEEKSVGDNVILVPQYTGDPSEIIWKVNGRKLVEMKLKPQVDRKFYRLQDRATISDTDGSLTIWDLSREDSGDYTAVVLVNNDYYYTEIRLPALKYSHLSADSIRIVFVVLTLITITIVPLWYCCRKYSRLSGGDIDLLVIGVLSLIAIINFIVVLCYYDYNKSSRLSGGDIALIISGVLAFNSILNFLLLLYFYFKESRGPSGGDIALIVIRVLCLIAIINFILFLWYYYYYKSIRRSGGGGDIFPKVVAGVLLLIAILCSSLLLWYCCYKKSIRLSGWSIALLVILILILPIPITIVLLWYHCCQKKIKRRERLILEMRNSTSKVVEDKREEESESCITVKFCNDDKSQTEESCTLLENCSKGTQSLTLCGVKSVGKENFTAEAVLYDRKADTFTDGTENKEKESDTKHVKELVWKKDGVTIFKWANSSLKFLTSNIKLKPKSVTVYDAEGKKSYKVTVYDAEGKKSYKVFFRLEGHPKSKSIRCITFHPIKMTGKDQITWKKDSQLLNTEGDRFKCDPNGDLTIYNATSEDKGKYTVQCKDKKLDQEFILHL